jgi:hypothetical protein
MTEKSSAMQPSQMLLKLHRITKQIIEIYIMKSKQATYVTASVSY